MTAHRRRAALAVLSLTLLASACPQPDDGAACEDAPDDLVEAVGQHLIEGGNIRFSVVVRANGDDAVFVSFENRTDDDVDDDDSGHILTLTAPTFDSTELTAVDERAREETDYPDADVDVRADGAIESRGCVAARRAES